MDSNEKLFLIDDDVVAGFEISVRRSGMCGVILCPEI